MSTSNPSYKPSEGKREEFRKYLEKNGVMDALTRVLVNLYEEVDKPEDALEYIRDKLAVIAGLETNKQLQTKLNDAEDRIKELEAALQTEEKTGKVDRSSLTDGSATQQADIAPAEDVTAKADDPVSPTEEPPSSETQDNADVEQ
ncbi:c-Myc-binding protein homolog [Dendroctonus ponderosae]|uniref:c-Myc-binding protein n=1 Tax=Dendroctonus ponderosae TaxID=77166 RepID=U4U232_DENPD|nr:c-Myc-binding protein homolog [Dendroctonus ponderosae]ERL84676.1 hypothetical protein D910_02103 [Dendroctonus ponderosae]KAH1027177.1 hypothetical protein HUJ05_000736 [Dendroctonus ponderosae]KAH1027178.1 hypothetical protein HUJ05_000736 [Dendroctonus ponderosae]